MTKHSHRKFWMVFTPDGGAAPKFMHSSRMRAEAEARRLAQVRPGCSFFVLKAVGGFIAEAPKVSPVKVLPVADDEIPF